jgi:hypothetical protein
MAASGPHDPLNSPEMKVRAAVLDMESGSATFSSASSEAAALSGYQILAEAV